MSQLVLSLFPGIGLLDMAFEESGFCVVRGPDLLWGGDIHTFHPPAGRFDGVIGGPPCQAFSRLRNIVEANGYQTAPNLIPEFERVVGEAKPTWFIMENVPDAPAPLPQRRDGTDYWINNMMVRDVWCGGETDRLRRFNFGHVHRCRVDAWMKAIQGQMLALHRPDPDAAALASSGGRRRPVALDGSGKPKRYSGGEINKGRYDWAAHCRAQGLPPDFLDGCPLTVAGKVKVVGNGVPLPMGRAVAAAVQRALAQSGLTE